MNFAIIKIGSNVLRMILSGLIDSCELLILESWSANLCLGDSVFKNGVVPENILQQL